jgi:SpoVK/Ycf46/Vps4 family AAA+-type ATPase
MHPDLKRNLNCMTYVNYVVSDEEDRVINAIANSFVKKADSKGPQKGPRSSVKIYNAAFGLIPVEQYQVSLHSRSLARDGDHGNIIKALEAIYAEDTQDRVHYYLITDPERYLQNDEVVRRILNIIHQVNSNIKIVKCLYFIGASLVIPPKLASYVHVIREDNLADEEIQEILDGLTPKTREKLPSEAFTWFRGLTAYQVTSAAGQAIGTTKKDPDPKKRWAITQEHILQYKRERVRKTDLLKLIDTSDFSFDKVGGLDRFKAWAQEKRHAWSKKGKEFGLRPPRGVLCVGVWGCGKSLSVKALGHAWGLPVVQLELGKLRDPGVGVTEANTYRVTRFAEAMAPCIVWCDEAEKSFAGAQSSSRSDAGTTSRSLAILSTWLQETSAEICLAMTTNSLTTLPVEFTNRMSERFFFDIPSEDDRVDILKIHLSTVGKLSKAQIAEVNLRRLAEVSENMVPREMEQAVEAALGKSFVLDKPCLDCEVLEHELRTKPRILKTMDTEVREVINWVGYDETSRDGLRARFASTKHSSNTTRLLDGGLE